MITLRDFLDFWLLKFDFFSYSFRPTPSRCHKTFLKIFWVYSKLLGLSTVSSAFIVWKLFFFFCFLFGLLNLSEFMLAKLLRTSSWTSSWLWKLTRWWIFRLFRFNWTTTRFNNIRLLLFSHLKFWFLFFYYRINLLNELNPMITPVSRPYALVIRILPRQSVSEIRNPIRVINCSTRNHILKTCYCSYCLSTESTRIYLRVKHGVNYYLTLLWRISRSVQCVLIIWPTHSYGWHILSIRDRLQLSSLWRSDLNLFS